jgi:hypothetical protein
MSLNVGAYILPSQSIPVACVAANIGVSAKNGPAIDSTNRIFGYSQCETLTRFFKL